MTDDRTGLYDVFATRQEALDEGALLASKEADPERGTAYSQYTLPGGENYRELVFTLPDMPKGSFTHQHWEGVDNPVAHVRFNERVDDAGRKTLFIEEVQSDWHQAGRKEGYQTLDEPKTLDDIAWKLKELAAARGIDTSQASTPLQELRDLRDPEVDRLLTNWFLLRDGHEIRARGVPEAPFSKTWPELVMKRMVRWAAENNFDQVAWTTGAQQAARFPDEKNAAGMSGFYDTMLPSIMSKFGKKFGAQVEQATIDPKVNTTFWFGETADGAGVGGWASREDALREAGPGGRVYQQTREPLDDQKPSVVHALPITPTMKRTALEQGFPQYITDQRPRTRRTLFATGAQEGPDPGGHRRGVRSEPGPRR